MNSETDPRPRLLRALLELARELPPNALNALITALETGGGLGLERIAATPAMRERLRTLEELCRLQSEVDSKSIGFALRAAAQAGAAAVADHRAEIAWTGPATEAVPLRRVDQVMYDMIETAKEDVLLVTYAAYKAERALTVLRHAAGRGVHVRLVIELANESGGKITFDGLGVLRAAVPYAEIYYWPLERRERTLSGAYGAMHAKCLITDRCRAIVSSANLTDFALELNMELGLSVGRAVAARLSEHFVQLIARGELVPVT